MNERLRPFCAHRAMAAAPIEIARLAMELLTRFNCCRLQTASSSDGAKGHKKRAAILLQLQFGSRIKCTLHSCAFFSFLLCYEFAARHFNTRFYGKSARENACGAHSSSATVIDRFAALVLITRPKYAPKGLSWPLAFVVYKILRPMSIC